MAAPIGVHEGVNMRETCVQKPRTCDDPVWHPSTVRQGYTTLLACCGSSNCDGHWPLVERFVRTLSADDLHRLFHSPSSDMERAVAFYRTLFDECSSGGRAAMLLTFWEGTVVGIGTLLPLRDSHMCELNFVVQGTFRKDGIARAMLLRLLTLARARNFWHAYVEVDGAHAHAMRTVALRIDEEKDVHQEGDEMTIVYHTRKALHVVHVETLFAMYDATCAFYMRLLGP